MPERGGDDAPVWSFFEREGFRRADPGELPDSKWRDYDAERRARVVCLLRRRWSGRNAPPTPGSGASGASMENPVFLLRR